VSSSTRRGRFCSQSTYAAGHGLKPAASPPGCKNEPSVATAVLEAAFGRK
jgi:hypothetical protein